MSAGSTYIYRTKGTATNDKIGTFSVWLKRGELGANRGLWQTYASGSDRCVLYWGAADTLGLYGLGGTSGVSVTTTRVFRDVSAWYHIVVAIDTTQATPADRVKIYVNGVQETSFSATSYPAEDGVLKMLSSSTVEEIARDGGDSTQNFSGSFSHLHRIDGTAYPASDFGETDATSGIWKIKTSPSVTYGTNGYFLKFEDSSNMDLDSSSNGHSFTTSGNLTATYDNPSNNFATMNPLDNYYAASTFTNGNNTISTNAANKTFNTSTLAVASGKWYWEVKITTTASESAEVGIASVPSTQSAGGGGELNHSAGNYEYRSDGTKGNNNSNTSWGNTWNTDDDIVGVALDLDNSKLYFSKNGVWQESGDPTSGATGTGAAFTVTAPASQTLTGSLNAYTPALGEEGAQTDVFSVNFGNGYFGTTLITSPEADDAGIGAFKYDVPTGYYALCTKNIKAYGG